MFQLKLSVVQKRLKNVFNIFLVDQDINPKGQKTSSMPEAPCCKSFPFFLWLIPLSTEKILNLFFYYGIFIVFQKSKNINAGLLQTLSAALLKFLQMSPKFFNQSK